MAETLRVARFRHEWQDCRSSSKNCHGEARWSEEHMVIPGIPPYPESVAPGLIVDRFPALLLQFVVLAVVLVVVLLLQRRRQQRAGTQPAAARKQMLIALVICGVVVVPVNAIAVAAFNESQREAARDANYATIHAYDWKYAEAIHTVYGFDITADDANVLLAGVELDVAYADGTPVTVTMVDEYEPRAGLEDHTTGAPIPTLAEGGE
jgi:hypothetical protein